ncbi:hypothetical protein FJY94_03435 [Candidatus Kaiserbacteria bacterium]|nr:hypothetical protein [Candidatus Kaiserbacteria bacterium]
MASNNSGNSGIGFVGVLAVAFIVLKLTHYIDWPWWAVLSPLWVSVLVWLAIAAVVVIAVSKLDL